MEGKRPRLTAAQAASRNGGGSAKEKSRFAAERKEDGGGRAERAFQTIHGGEGKEGKEQAGHGGRGMAALKEGGRERESENRVVVKRRRPCARRRWAAGVGAVDLSPSSPSTSTCLFFCFFFPSSSLFCFFFFFFSFCSFFPIFCLLFFSSSLFSHCHFLSLVFLLLILIFLGYHLGDYGRFAAVFEWICYIEFKGELKNTCKRIDNEFEDFKVLTSPQRTKTSSNLEEVASEVCVTDIHVDEA